MKYKSFEDFLITKHAEQYRGLDDEMPDDYSDWLSGMDIDEMIHLGDAWMKEEKSHERR